MVPIESAYATSYSSVIVTLVLSCTASELLQVFVLLTPHLFHPILEVFPLDQIADVGVNVSRYLNLFGRDLVIDIPVQTFLTSNFINFPFKNNNNGYIESEHGPVLGNFH